MVFPILNYLNLVQKIAIDKFNGFTTSTSEQFSEIKKKLHQSLHLLDLKNLQLKILNDQLESFHNFDEDQKNTYITELNQKD